MSRTALMLLACVAAAGCFRVAAPAAVPAPPKVAFTPPVLDSKPVPEVDVTRLKVDVAKRTVEFYELPETGRWYVVLPGDHAEEVKGLTYTVAEDTDLADVQVYLFVPGSPPSLAARLPLGAKAP